MEHREATLRCANTMRAEFQTPIPGIAVTQSNGALRMCLLIASAWIGRMPSFSIP
jgi:hypothetical protein